MSTNRVQSEGPATDERSRGGAERNRWTHAEERQLVSWAREGDHRAFGVLVTRHQDTVFGLIVRMVRGEAEAEELTQDVFLKAYHGLDRFRGDAAFATWLYRISVNHVRDYLASRAARNKEKEVSLGEPGSAASIDVASVGAADAEILEAELGTEFAECLAGLEGHLKEAFLLRHQENLDYEAIAGVLGISRGNARVRVHRARARILEELRKRGVDV